MFAGRPTLLRPAIRSRASILPTSFSGLTRGSTQPLMDVMTGYVYIMASKPHGTLYIGVTNDIARRATEHRAGTASKFTSKYGCKLLVWYELHDTVPEAIAREKQLKKWLRAWKISLVETINPEWRDLFEELNM